MMPLLIALPLSLVGILLLGLLYGVGIELREHPGERLSWEAQLWKRRERLRSLHPESWQEAQLLRRARRSLDADMALLHQLQREESLV